MDNLGSDSFGGGEAYAFVPVWRRLSLQLVILAALCGLLALAVEWLGFELVGAPRQLLALALAALPVALWLALSVMPEFRLARPRRRLIGVAVVSGLTASAIGVPVMEGFFRVESWLPLQSVFQRILGYTFTLGLLDAGLKFVVMRYTVFPEALRVRRDPVAYAFAGAIGYSFYVNLALMARLELTVDLAAIYALSNVALQTASSLFIALGMIESHFSDAFPLTLPVNLLAGAFAAGAIAALLGGFLSGPLGLAGSADRPLFGLALLYGALLATVGFCYFLFSNSERREREAFRSGGVGDDP